MIEPQATPKVMFTVERGVMFGVESLRHIQDIGDLFNRASELAILIAETPFLRETEVFTNPERAGHVTRDQLKRAIELHDFQGVEGDSDEYNTLLEAVSFKEQLARRMIRSIITSENNLGLTPTETIFLEKGTRIQDLFDRFHRKWRQEITQGDVFAELNRLQHTYETCCRKVGKEPDPNFAFHQFFEQEAHLGKHGDYLYVMPRKTRDGRIEAIPYPLAFPDEILGEVQPDGSRKGGIIDLLDEMVTELSPYATEDVNAAGLIATGKALRNLLACTGSAMEQETLAEELDRVWVTQAPATGPNTNTVRIGHLMEAYTDPWQILVEPDFFLWFRDRKHERLNDSAQEAKRHLLNFFESDTDFQQFSTLGQSLPVVDRSAATFFYMLRSGSSMGFKSAASNVPNRPAIRQHEGTIIDMDFSSFVERQQIARGLLTQLFTNAQGHLDEEQFVYFADDAIVIEMLGAYHVPLHEFGHTVFVVEDTIERLTNPIYANLEEAKADLISIVVALSRLQGEKKQQFVSSLFASELRGLSRWQERNDRTHFHGNAQNIQLMLDTGIVQQQPDKSWSFHPTEENISRFWTMARERLLKFAQVYEARDADKAEEFMEKYFVVSPLLRALAQKAGIDTSSH